MKNKIISRISTGFLMLAILVVPQLSYADWGVGVSIGNPGYHHDDHHLYRWHEHPRYGLHMRFLPEGYLTIHVGLHRYYYYDGLYYNYVGHGDYEIVSPPVGAYVSAIPSDFQPVIINGRTYYTDNGVYYILTRHHGYKVVMAPVVYAQPAAVIVDRPVIRATDTFPINVPNNRGAYMTIVIKRSGHGFVGPQGEYYPEFPRVAQLKVMYGR